MTSEALKKILWLYMHDSADMNHIMNCIEDYCASKQAPLPAQPVGESPVSEAQQTKPLNKQ